MRPPKLQVSMTSMTPQSQRLRLSSASGHTQLATRDGVHGSADMHSVAPNP